MSFGRQVVWKIRTPRESYYGRQHSSIGVKGPDRRIVTSQRIHISYLVDGQCLQQIISNADVASYEATQQ